MVNYDLDQWSSCLNRNMHIKVYGHYGTPIIIFPCQYKMSDDFSNYGMIDNLKDYIEGGKIKLYCVDSVDYESFDYGGDKGHRSYILDCYFYYVIEELLPLIYENCNGYVEPLLIGCSMGANHAANIFFRRPDLFKGVLGLSGVYDVPSFFDYWCDDRLYNNSPLEYLKNMDNNHHYIDIYRNKKIIFCVGQGPWEDPGCRSLRELDDILRYKNIPAWCDYWGYDTAHDWFWWKIQIRYFLPHLID